MAASMNGGQSYSPGGYLGDDIPPALDGCAEGCPVPVGGDHLPDCQRCAEILFDDGEPLAICTEPYGTEHSHSDYSAAGSILAGIASPYRGEAYDVVADGVIRARP